MLDLASGFLSLRIGFVMMMVVVLVMVVVGIMVKTVVMVALMVLVVLILMKLKVIKPNWLNKTLIKLKFYCGYHSSKRLFIKLSTRLV